MSFPEFGAEEVGWLTGDQMVEVDRVMIEDLHIELIQMMENAGRNLAQLVLERFDPDSVTVLCGSGGNGGGGMVAARHLANAGVPVKVTLGGAVDRLTAVPAHQFDILQRMGVMTTEEPASAELVIDALIGYSLKGAPHGRIAELISSLRSSANHVVSLDTPSGLNVDDGTAPGAVVQADATLTLALPKVGMRTATHVGELFVADISVPPSVYTAIGNGPAPDFSRGQIIKIRRAPLPIAS